LKRTVSGGPGFLWRLLRRGEEAPTTGHSDLARLLLNSIAWVAGATQTVKIEGEGTIESFARETEPEFAVHILNYTNLAMHRGWMRDFFPVREQKVRMVLPPNRRVSRVELLRAETTIPFRMNGGTIEFTVPRVVDYEVAAIHAS
jgi:hypothetical protein